MFSLYHHHPEISTPFSGLLRQEANNNNSEIIRARLKIVQPLDTAQPTPICLSLNCLRAFPQRTPYLPPPGSSLQIFEESLDGTFISSMIYCPEVSLETSKAPELVFGIIIGIPLTNFVS